MRKRTHLLILSLAAATLMGCGNSVTSSSVGPPSGVSDAPPKPEIARVTDREANTDGQVFVIEYHKIAKQEARWDRSIEQFKKDLLRLYTMGFRPITLAEYLNDGMTLPPGASPIVFTFDDSHVSQFRMLADGSVDPDCAVGIWMEFAKTRPDFPVKASFYVLPPTPWGQKEWVAKKFEMLKEWGCEIGSHTVTHTSLAKLDDAGVKGELAGSMDFIAKAGFECRTLALPYGISPKNPELLHSFERDGKRYQLDGALLVGANPAPAPTSAKLNRYRIPRIQCIEGDYGLGYWLDLVEQDKVKPYVAP